MEKRIDRLSDKNANRPSGQLPSNTQQNPRPPVQNAQSQKYQPPPTRNEHVNAISTRSGKSYNSPTIPTETTDPIVQNSDNEIEIEEEAEPIQTVKTSAGPPKPVVSPELKAYKPRIPFPQRS